MLNRERMIGGRSGGAEDGGKNAGRDKRAEAREVVEDAFGKGEGVDVGEERKESGEFVFDT